MGHIGLAQSADHQEDAHVGSGIVDGNGSARNCNVLLGTSCHIDIVVSRSVMTDVPERLGEFGEQLGIERTGVLAHAEQAN